MIATTPPHCGQRIGGSSWGRQGSGGAPRAAGAEIYEEVGDGVFAGFDARFVGRAALDVAFRWPTQEARRTRRVAVVASPLHGSRSEARNMAELLT